MKEPKTSKTNNLNKRLIIWAVIVAVILMIPAVLQAPWSLGDYIVAGAVLFGSAAGYEITSSRLKNKSHRLIAAVVAFGVVISIWAFAVSGS